MATAALTGTATTGITEADVVTGGKIITITLTGDTWLSSGPQHIQSNTVYEYAATSSFVCVLDSDVTAGDTIIVFAGVSSGADYVTGCSDPVNGAYTQRAANATNRLKLYEKANSSALTGSSNRTITVTYNASTAANHDIGVLVVRNLKSTGAFVAADMLKETSSGGSSAPDGDVSNSLSVTYSGSFLLGIIRDIDGGFTSLSAGTGWTLADSTTSCGPEYKLATSTGNTTATWTAGDTDNYQAIIAEFQAA